jgi:hypothetical protein
MVEAVRWDRLQLLEQLGVGVDILRVHDEESKGTRADRVDHIF